MEPSPSGLRSAQALLTRRMQQRIRRAQEVAAHPGARYIFQPLKKNLQISLAMFTMYYN